MQIDARSRQGGFTLIELLIVMVVLSILAGIVLFKVGTFRGDAEASACRTDVRTLATANAAYMAGHGTDAPNIDALIDGGYINEPPKSGLAFSDGETTPATADGCIGLSASPTTTPTTSTPPTSVPVTVSLAGLGGTTQRDGFTDDWTATVTVTVGDTAGDPVDGAQVTGSWSDGASPSSCTTGASGSCSFTSPHTTTNPSIKRTWTLTSVTKAGSTAGSDLVTALTCGRAGPPGGTTVCVAS